MQSTPTPKRPLALGEIFAWGIIIATIGIIFGLSLITQTLLKTDHTNQDRESPDLRILISSRYAVGTNSLFSALTSAPENAAAHQEKIDTKLLPSLEKSATTSWDKLRVAIVHGELSGKSAALSDLDKLEKQYAELHADIRLLRSIYNPPDPSAPLPAQWQNFHQRNGWFADLALSAGKPLTDANRASVMHRAHSTLAAALILIVGGLLLLCAGIPLLIIAIVFVANGRIKPVYRHNPALPIDRRVYIEAFAWFMALHLGLGLFFYYILKVGSITSSVIGLVVSVAVALAWPFLRGQSWPQYKAAMGLHTGKGVLVELGAGALGYLMGIPLFVVGLLLTNLFTRLTGVDASHPIQQEIAQSGPFGIFLLVLLATVWAPVTEELVFRGAFFSNLRERHGWWISALTLSLFFAMIHPQGWAAIPILGSIALTLAAIREWRGSILGCMMAHAINNSIAMLLLLFLIS